MATKYLVPETAVTEQAGPFWVKGDAVACADASAAEHPGTTFTVVTGKGTVVHTALTDVPAPESEEDITATANDAADSSDDQGDEDNASCGDSAAEQDAAAGADPADSPEASDTLAQTIPSAELCATNTWANIAHIRRLDDQSTVCGSATTSRRASARQVAEAKRCKFCAATAEKEGLVVDERPAGSGQARTGSRRRPKTLVVDAGDIRDLVAHLKNGQTYTLELTDGTRVEVHAGDPVTGEADTEASEIRSLSIVSS